jgi:hypothetical protein
MVSLMPCMRLRPWAIIERILQILSTIIIYTLMGGRAAHVIRGKQAGGPGDETFNYGSRPPR